MSQVFVFFLAIESYSHDRIYIEQKESIESIGGQILLNAKTVINLYQRGFCM